MNLENVLRFVVDAINVSEWILFPLAGLIAGFYSGRVMRKANVTVDVNTKKPDLATKVLGVVYLFIIVMYAVAYSLFGKSLSIDGFTLFLRLAVGLVLYIICYEVVTIKIANAPKKENLTA